MWIPLVTGQCRRNVALALASVLFVVASLAPGSALADTYDTATLVNITTGSKDDVSFLYDNRIDIVGVRGGVYKALLSREQLQKVEDHGLTVEILYAEMAEDRARWAEASASYAFATSYYTPSKFTTTNPPAGSLMEHLLQQYTAHPDITRLYNLGASQDGAYDIIAMKVSKNPDTVEAEPKIRIYANIHGDEKGGVMVSCDVLDTILAGYTAAPQNATAKKLVDETEMWFIPIGNPYGNANNTRYNSNGKDLNRNFWGPAGSDVPPAWSEKETQIVRDLTETATADHAKKRFALSISFHEGEIVFNSVWNYTTLQPADEPIFWSSRTGGTGCVGQTIANCPTLAPHGLAQAYRDGCTKAGFWYTEGYDWYGTKGDTNDWAYGAWTQLDTTIELNSQKTPAASQIPTYCAEHRQAVLNYMMKAFQGIHGVMTDQSTGAPLDGTVTVTATASADIPVPHAYQAIYTDPVAGDFHRILQPGTYSVVCSAPGHMTTTITGVVVTADTKTIANCVMNATGLKYGSSSVADSCSGGGAFGGDGILDAGEDATLQVTLSNPGAAAATSVQGTISTATPGITITQGTASFADVPGGGTGASLPPHFRFNVGAGVACGTAVPFNLHMTSAQGAWDDVLTVAVGQSTSGAAQTVVSESFDGATFPPTGWAQLDVSGTAGNWVRSTGTVHPASGGTHSGAGLAYFNSGTVSTNGTATRLYRSAGSAIPASATSASVTFWMFHDTGDTGSNDRVQVQVSTNGTTWTNVGSAISRYDGTNEWKQHAVPLDAYLGQPSVQVWFLGTSSAGNDCHIDDVRFSYTPQITCAMHGCAAVPSADLAATMSGPASVATNANASFALGVSNNGPQAASNVQLSTATPVKTTFISIDAPAGWNCTAPAVGATGPVTCAAATLAASGTANFTMVVKVDGCAGNGGALNGSAAVSSSTNDPSPANNAPSTSTTIVDNGACDDVNACTTGDACAGAVCVGTPVGAPPEVASATFLTSTMLGWDAVAAGGPPATYDVVRGVLGQWPAGTGASEACVQTQLAANQTDLTDVPAPDAGAWYLVRARSSCGIGTYGAASDETPRGIAACP
jgi:hypothetical protein